MLDGNLPLACFLLCGRACLDSSGTTKLEWMGGHDDPLSFDCFQHMKILNMAGLHNLSYGDELSIRMNEKARRGSHHDFVCLYISLYVIRDG